MSSEKPNPGYGYELCEWDAPSPIEFYDGYNVWLKSVEPCSRRTYRRPIKPPSDLCIHGEWVLLPENEKMRSESDSRVADVIVYRNDAGSSFCHGFNCQCPNQFKEAIAAVFRRVCKPEVKSDDGWMRTNQERPTKGIAVWVWSAELGQKKAVLIPCADAHTAELWTHWKPAEVPAPPVVKSDAEKAWENVVSIQYDNSNPSTHLKTAFIAGFNAAKGTP